VYTVFTHHHVDTLLSTTGRELPQRQVPPRPSKHTQVTKTRGIFELNIQRITTEKLLAFQLSLSFFNFIPKTGDGVWCIRGIRLGGKPNTAFGLS